MKEYIQIWWNQMDGTDLASIIITILLIAGMYFVIKGIPRLFPKQMKSFREFYFGKGYMNDKQKIARMKDRM